MNKILVINTGGTITMVHTDINDESSPLRPAKDLNEVLEQYQFIMNLDVDFTQTSEIIDSSNMNGKLWAEMATIVRDNYDKYMGFIILHGTDTMSYSASMVSYMLKNLSKPVIFTGAQLPVHKRRSDGVQNILTSYEIIKQSYKNGVSCLPEVAIFFRDHLFRGNRSKKLDSTNYLGFGSPNYSNLCDVGIKVRFRYHNILPMPTEKFYIDTRMDDHVLVLQLFPGIHPEIIKSLVDNNELLKGIVLLTYGSGNAPTTEEFLEVIRYIQSKGIIIVNISQCQIGSVELGMYEANALLAKESIISGHDMTVEATVTKLMYALGVSKNIEEIKEVMNTSLAGEVTFNF